MKQKIIKAVPIVLLGVLLIAMLLSAFYRLLPSDSSCPKAYESSDTVRINANQMILVTNNHAVALIDFTHFGWAKEKTTYRWRYRSITDGKESSGTGVVFEKYIGNKFSIDTGSQIVVSAGVFRIEWSYGTPEEKGGYGWLCCNLDDYGINIMPDDGFETMNLIKISSFDNKPLSTQSTP